MSDPAANPRSNPFEDLAGYQQVLVPIALQLSQQQPAPGGGSETEGIAAAQKIRLEIRNLTSRESEAADAIMDAAKPPPIHTEEPAKVGVRRILTGYDFEDPDYLATRDRLNRKREAYVCLFGCPALMETTPGGNVEEKAATLRDRIPEVALRLICANIESLGVSSVVGQEEVDRFFTAGSGSEDGASSPPSSTRSRKRAKRKS